MGNEDLESKIKEFIEIADKFDERYRQKIFEVLLTSYLRGTQAPEEVSEKVEIVAPTLTLTPTQKFVIPIGVKAVLQQYNVPEEDIEKLFVIEGNEIQPKFKITTTNKSDAQLQVAMLTALENALRPGGKFEFSMETVRTRCKGDYAIYDSANFKKHFKDNAKLFKNLDDEEHVELSPDGKAELADVILAVAG